MKFYPKGLLVLTVCVAAGMLQASALLGIVDTRLLIVAVVVLLAIEFIGAYRALFGGTRGR
jgi:hypothetical protein